MTEKERMEQGIIYNPNVSELTDEQSVYMEKLWEFNQLRPSEQDKKQKYMKEVFAECGEDCFIHFGKMPCSTINQYISEQMSGLEPVQ